MTIAVIGSDGQLGQDICAVFFQAGHTVIGYDAAPIHAHALDITDAAATSAVLQESRPHVIINTAAMHHVEKCEQDPSLAFQVNVLGARHVALAANAIDALLIHISTDYVFDGEKGQPYVESDAPMPLNMYGNTKLAGEYAVRAIAKKHFVARVSGIYGANPCRAKGANFVELMLRLAKERQFLRVVDDEVLTPTATIEIARQLLHMVEKNAAFGLYHVTAEGQCSWYEFASAIFSTSHLTVDLQKAAPGEFPAKVARPAYSVLENGFLKRQGLNIMRDWQQGLADYLHATGRA